VSTSRRAPELTIDQLARRTGSTTRNIRAHQTAGLLPAPRLDGRTARYDATHLERLRAIERLQDQGFSLAAIRALFDAFDDGRSLDDVLGLSRHTHAPRRGVDERRSRRLRLALVPGPVATQLRSA
jgi:DNA-binding transcriptional MerR regulator